MKNLKIVLLVFVFIIVGQMPISAEIQESDWPVIEAAIRYSQVVKAQNGVSGDFLNIIVEFASESDDRDPPAAFFERFRDVDYAVVSRSQAMQREDVGCRFAVGEIQYPTSTKAILCCLLGRLTGHTIVEYELEFSSGEWIVVDQRNPYEIIGNN